MQRKTGKKLLKIALVIYVASFLVINWADVSWVFNYRTVTGLVEDFFNPYPTISAETMNAYFYPNHSKKVVEDTKPVAGDIIKDVKTSYTDKQNTLEIPKLSISVPIIFSTSNDIKLVTKDLDSGVVFYPGSVYPGQIGQIVVLGHSAPPGWPKIKHDWVFTNIDKLLVGDSILIDINNKQYTYTVQKTTIIKRGEDVPTEGLSENSNVLTLISCWPPGKDYQRIAVQATLSVGQ